MKRRLLSVLLCLFSFSLVAAPVYKHVDAQGNVTYSDKPAHDEDQPVELKPVSVIPGRKPAQSLKKQPVQEAAEQKPVRYRLEWLQPQQEQTFRNTGGQIQADLKIEPGLPRGTRVELWLDGKKKAEWKGAPVTLSEVWRGQHSLEARVIDANGKTLARSSVTFFMHQASLLISTPIQNGG